MLSHDFPLVSVGGLGMLCENVEGLASAGSRGARLELRYALIFVFSVCSLRWSSLRFAWSWSSDRYDSISFIIKPS